MMLSAEALSLYLSIAGMFILGLDEVLLTGKGCNQKYKVKACLLVGI